MEKELKSCKGVLLRADLTGQGHLALLGRNLLIGWVGYALLDQPSKGHPCRILILFPFCSTTFLVPHIKKLETYFALFIIHDFRTVCVDCYDKFWLFERLLWGQNFHYTLNAEGFVKHFGCFFSDQLKFCRNTNLFRVLH